MEKAEEKEKLKIADLQDKQGNVNIDVRIFWDNAPAEEKFGKLIKSVLVADVGTGEGGPTAYLDLYDEDAKKYVSGDSLRITNAYAKLVKSKDPNKKQFRITNAKQVELLESGKIEKKSAKATQELIDKFSELCEDYISEDIDTDMLKKGLNEIVDNWS